MNIQSVKQKLHEHMQTGGQGGRLDIPLDSTLPRYAGFTMIAAAAACLLSAIISYCNRYGFTGIFRGIFNGNTFLALLLVFAPFIVVSLIHKKNITLFLIPVILLNINNLRTLASLFHLSGLSALFNFLTFLLPIYMLVIFIMIITEKLTDKKQIVYLLAIPVAAIAAICLIQLCISLGSNITHTISRAAKQSAAASSAKKAAAAGTASISLVRTILVTLFSGIFGLISNCLLYAAYPVLALGLDNNPDKEYLITGSAVNENGELFTDELQVEKNVGLCILFSILTCGIYMLYWQYTMVKKIRLIDNDKSSFIGEYLCLILVPFYSIYWFYTMAPRLYRGASSKNIYLTDNRTLYLILSILLPIAAYAILQADLNTIAKQLNGEIKTQPQSTAQAAAPVQNLSTADELAKYKKLLDNGTITQEEFDAKKKQLLDL